jgi:hypothetical protein
MSARRHLARVGAKIALATTLGSALLIGGTTATSSAWLLTNTKPSGLYNCDPMSATITSACLTGALSDFNAARRKEGLKAMVLPSNFASMSVPNQLFTLTNIERRDRGIGTFLLLSPNLTSYVLYAANHALDPLFPSWTREGGSNWASPKNTLWADFVWMYDDGLGSGNMDCTTGNTSGCWGHRQNILSNYSAPRIMGAATGSTGLATLMLGLDTHDAPAPRTPYAPGTLTVAQISLHRLANSWSVPRYRGAAILRYYVRLDGKAWASTGLRRTWTTGTLSRGYHTIGVRSYNKYGYSAIKSVRVYVR